MSEGLNIKKRVNSIKIEDMQPKEDIVDGRIIKFCLNCGKNIPASNLKYCSLKCSNEFYAKHNQQGLRKYVFKREHGICQMCGYKRPTPPKAPLKPKKPGWVEGGYKEYQKALLFYEQSLQDYKEAYVNWHETVYKEWKKVCTRENSSQII